MKSRYLFLIFLSAILVAVLSARTQLAGLALSSAMQSYGMSNISIDISQLDLNQSQLSRFGFSFVNNSGMFRLEASDVSINYDLIQLAEGRVDGVTIGTLLLHHEDTGYTQDSSTTTHETQIDETLKPLQILASLKQALARYLNFKAISVQHITMHGDYFALLQDRALRLNSINRDGALYTELELLNQPSSGQHDDLPRLLIATVAENSLIAELRFSTTAEPVPTRLELHLDETDTDTGTDIAVVSGSYRIIPAQLKHWLQPFADIDSLNETESVEGTLSLSFTAEEPVLSTITAVCDKLKINSYVTDDVVIKLKTSVDFTTPLQRIEIQNGSYIKVSNFTDNSFSLAAGRLFMVGELTGRDDHWQYKGGFRSDGLGINYQQQLLRLKDLAASISADTAKVVINGSFSPASIPGKFAFAVEHKVSEGSGQLSIKPIKPLDLNAEDNRLSQLVSPWTYPFELLTGNIRLASQATWSPGQDFNLTTKIKLEDGGGTLAEEIVFSGLAFDHELEILPKLHSIHAGNIDLKHLDSGVTTSDISTRLALKTTDTGALPMLAVQGLHGEIFGGSFSSDNFIFDLNKNKNHFKINATDIDLAAIVETQQLESIKVTGRVDGTIPVEINEQGILIQHGALINGVRAGTIHYSPGAGTEQLKQNPLTAVALDALKDFRYSHLYADVNFTPEGTLTVNLQLKGTSPELDTDRPVHLNINTEQNLITLLKSLRYAQGISDNIDNRVRHQYEKSRNKN